MNLFKKILEELPESKIEVVPDDPKDQEVANQMSALLRYQKTLETTVRGVKFSKKVWCGKKWDEQNENQ